MSRVAFGVIALCLAGCHGTVESDCNDYDALKLQCPNVAMISITDDEKYCKAFAQSSALAKCDEQNKAQLECLLGEPNVCDDNAATSDCGKLEAAAGQCMKAYCVNHKDDPGCARNL